MARGGAVPRNCDCHAARLMKRGHEVSIITPRPKEVMTVDTEV